LHRPPPHPPSFPTRRSSDLSRVRGHLVRNLSSGQEIPDLARQLGADLLAGPLAVEPPDAKPLRLLEVQGPAAGVLLERIVPFARDRKSTRLNSSHLGISYAV